MYLYTAEVFHTTTNAVGVPASNATDLTDFNTAGRKSAALLVTTVEVAETTFQVAKTYQQFKALIDGVNITWSLVKYVDNGVLYTLYLASENPL